MPDAHALLSRCEHPRCTALSVCLCGWREPVALGYEDVFYPLRHHAQDDLTLITWQGDAVARRVYWGGGDWLSERIRSGNDPIVNPRPVWLPIEAGVVDIDYVCWEGFEDVEG